MIVKHKKKYNIGLDFDNTLVKTKQNAIKIAAKSLGIRIDLSKPRGYNFEEYPLELKSKIFEMFDDPKHATDLTILPGVIKKLEEWKLDCHKLIVITARNEPIREATRHYVEKYFPMIDELHFVDMGSSKVEKQQELKIDIWIDDSPIDVPAAYKAGIQSFLISNSDTPYNEPLKKTPGNFVSFFTSIADINFPYALQKSIL